MDVEAIRQRVVDALPELGYEKTDPNWETLLIVDGTYTGRRFEFDDLRAYWFVERQAIEFYGAEWQLLRTIELQSPAATTATAAS